MNLRQTGYDDGRRMYLSQDLVQWQALVLVVSNLHIMLPDSNTDDREIGCEDMRWMDGWMRIGLLPVADASISRV
jgi:hypothetical protein